MRTIEDMTEVIVRRLQQMSILKDLTPDSDMYKAIQNLLINQPAITTVLSNIGFDGMFEGSCGFIVLKIMEFFPPKITELRPTDQQLYDRMVQYIIDNQAMTLGIGLNPNNTNIHACATFQVYSTRQYFHNGYLDRDLIVELTRSAVKNYEKFVSEVEQTLTANKGAMLIISGRG